MLNFERNLIKRKYAGNLRSLQTFQTLIDFASNDYLGLAKSSKLAQAGARECTNHSGKFNGLGSTGSRLLTGNSIYAQELETQIARFHGFATGTLFSCGYMANLGLLSAVADSQSTVIFDSAVHASTRDGIRLSRAKGLPFRHNDLEHLQYRLRNRSSNEECFVCIESIYSTDGSRAPLLEISRLAQEYNARLIVDEAHAVGVYGPYGRGLVAEHDLTAQVFAQIVTFGKALGTFGAIVLGNGILQQALINFANSYVYTTALPFQVLASIRCSYDLFPAMEDERRHLSRLTQIFQEAYLSSSKTHIHSLLFKGNEAAKIMAQNCRGKGFDSRPLLSPTVRKGQEALRICLHAFNTEKEVKALINFLHMYRE